MQCRTRIHSCPSRRLQASLRIISKASKSDGMLELPDDIGALLAYDPKTGAVSTREGKRLEFKRDFVKADFSDYTKVLASFANALGGVIIFGVSDSPRRVEGCLALPDEAAWADRLREDFDPEIPFAVHAYKIGAVTLHVVGVGPAAHKPVLCKKNRTKLVTGPKGSKDVEVLREGSIYYRYAGQTRLINYSDLSTMLAERESMYLLKMMETLQVVQKVGIENAGVVDMSVPHSSVYMSGRGGEGLVDNRQSDHRSGERRSGLRHDGQRHDKRDSARTIRRRGQEPTNGGGRTPFTNRERGLPGRPCENSPGAGDETLAAPWHRQRQQALHL
jgi:hypothetical protein